VRAAYSLHAEDDDFGQAHTLVREVMDEAARERLIDTVTGGLSTVEEPVLSKAFQYWKNIDQEVGEKIEAKVKAGQDGAGPRRGPRLRVIPERATA
jgi:catalase